MTDPPAARCHAVKHGRVDLTCALPQDHDRGESPTWHEATFADHQEITYPGARHVVDTTEHVTWEPADRVAEAVRSIMKDRPRD